MTKSPDAPDTGAKDWKWKNPDLLPSDSGELERVLKNVRATWWQYGIRKDVEAACADIEHAFERLQNQNANLEDACTGYRSALSSLRSTALTRDEAEWLMTGWPRHARQFLGTASWCACVKCENLHARLSSLRSSSLGEQNDGR